MAELRAKVMAVDFSEQFIDIARSKSSPDIDYRVIDATSKKALDILKGMTFDSVVSTMALMDMENIEILIHYIPFLLKRNGKFVFSVMHPCFNSGEGVLGHEHDESGGVVEDKYYVKISNYLVEKSSLGLGMIGQPKPQYYFHRPVSTLLRCCFNAGFILDAFEEPSFDIIEDISNLNFNVFKQIPPVLVCRLRLI
jgi:hypothetical protein